MSVRLTPARSARLQLWEFVKNAARLVIAETGLSLRRRVAVLFSSLFTPAGCLLLVSCVCVCVIGRRDKCSVCNCTGLVVYLGCIYRQT